MSGAVIREIEIAAAHDGVAELIVTLEFDNGGRSLVTLDEVAAGKLLELHGTDDPAELPGTSWTYVRDALAASSGRYAAAAE
ncbi:hypothetical protein B5C34_13425 [Pacificimonas flava]|uniref:Uncharacterized protein n=2 Tax=Pacificimonas TaxID=1960290 RepID=A0A219B967_9SPHN|nr:MULTISPECIES: hypothetical protein [Pacificimonas]MBZ6379824.1 hypothetical protein [Pacificimonas aurantium]OWV34359.1 hypothetical protein B5C34_13425 [Pacificimonas flava]